METQVHELTLGQVKVTVEAPAGASPARVMLLFRPLTVEGFDAAAEAIGGVEALNLPEAGAYYDTPAVRVEDGPVAVTGSIYPPPRSVVPDIAEPKKQPHPFFARYAQEAGK